MMKKTEANRLGFALVLKYFQQETRLPPISITALSFEKFTYAISSYFECLGATPHPTLSPKNKGKKKSQLHLNI